MDKTQAFIKLYQLLDFYFENRDRPVTEGFNFSNELQKYCDVLEIDRKELEKNFKLVFFE